MIEIEKPDLAKDCHKKAISMILEDNELFIREIELAQNPTYKNWQKVKYNQNFDPKILWAGIKIKRSFNSREIPIKSPGGKYFNFQEFPQHRQFFNEFDKNIAGNDFSINSAHQKIFIRNGILEEAINSSKIEGAVTSRKDAKDMIKNKKDPKGKSEQMIMNNYLTMNKIQDEWKDREMSLELLFEIHDSISKKTLDKKDIGRLRKNKDKIDIYDENSGEIAYHCPDEKFIKEEIVRLIDFANDKLGEEFLHPLLKAIILHFWIGFLHPFTDGNGRTARAIFYWYLIKHGYWAMPFIPISKQIISAQGQYRDAFLYTEQDDLDFNYFL